uniref:CCHC-type domain-containing protein n=1 Tax=Arcella intermedia TaxID=1963864 RepID=A0A6B2LGH8_9EUKA
MKEFGIFVKLPGFSKHGLIHVSQISNHRVQTEEIPNIVAMNEKVWVKVIQVGMDDHGNERLSLSMKYVRQSDGEDLDPNNVKLTMEQQRNKPASVHHKPHPFEMDAVLDTVCKRCGGKGHFAAECFHIKGEEVHPMLSDVEEEPDEEQISDIKSKLKDKLKEKRKEKKRKRHSDEKVEKEAKKHKHKHKHKEKEKEKKEKKKKKKGS